MSAIGGSKKGPIIGVVAAVAVLVVAGAVIVLRSSGDDGAKAATQTAAPSDAASQASLEFDPPQFKPAAATISDGGTVALRIISGGCDLTVDGKAAGRLLLPGDQYTWAISGKGDHKITCKGVDAASATITVK